MTKIAGVIMRATLCPKMAHFYEALGLSVDKHSHGGPLHYEVGPIHEDFVVEIYKVSAKYNADALMLEVSCLESAIDIVQSFGCEVRTPIQNSADIKFVYVLGPDNRTLMLYEKIYTVSEDEGELALQRCVPCHGNTQALSADEITQYLAEVSGWIMVGEGIEKIYLCKNFSAAASFISQIAVVADTENHHPDVHLESYKNVRLRFTTNAIHNLSSNDFIMAAKIDLLLKS